MESLQDTAAQLRCPSGATAAEAARMMNEIHGTLNRKCIEFMDITPGDRILETGPGNGAFVREIVEGPGNRVPYRHRLVAGHGAAGATLHAGLIERGRVEFLLGDSQALLVRSAMFRQGADGAHHLLLDDPARHLAEMHRV